MNNKVIDIEGIIISTRNYGDTSKILDILTKEYGVIGVIAKGCKSLKSNLRSITDKLTYATFTIYYKKDKLSILSEASVINNFSNIKKDIEKISYASFLMDLTKQVYKQCDDNNLYDLLISSLIKINDNFNPLIITNIIELKYLEYLGVMPNITGCSICGSKSVVTLSSDKGGYLCSKCHTNEPIVSDKAIKLVRMYTLVDIDKIEKLDIKKDVVYEVNNFINDYYDRYTGLYLKSKSFLKNIINIKN
ncbi:MAG: DNA repair protein RecO [Firmicutes bacterium]|nr:DNA repair protein RecO [Bacillota bacterium]